MFIDSVVSSLPASAQQLQMYRKRQAEDSECAWVQEYCKTGWPVKCLVEPDLLPYWKARSSLTMHKDLLLYNHHIVVPVALRKETLERVHEGHQGIEHCHSKNQAVSLVARSCRTCSAKGGAVLSMCKRSQPPERTPHPYTLT